MISLLKVCLKVIFYHQNINLHPTCTDFAVQVGRKGSGHPVCLICFHFPFYQSVKLNFVKKYLLRQLNF